MAARLNSKNLLMRWLARRLMAREIRRVGGSSQSFVRRSIDTLDAEASAQLRATFEGQELTVFVPHDSTPAQRSALLILARTFNAKRLVLVAEERDHADLRGLQQRFAGDSLRLELALPVADGSYRPVGGGASVLTLPEDDWRALGALPLGRPPLSIGSLSLEGVPSDVALHAFADTVQNLLSLLPPLTLRAETVVNLRAIA